MMAYTYAYSGTLTIESVDLELAEEKARQQLPEDSDLRLEDIAEVNPED